MCFPDKYGRPNLLCLLPLALLCMILGGGLVGNWVACYFECIRGRVVEYNYYSSVWTGGLAVFSGVLQFCLACCWIKPLKYFLVFFNVLLILCCLLCAALQSYLAYLESEETPVGSSPLGVILTALQAALALFILFFVMIWNCVIGCASLDEQPETYDEDRRSRRKTNRPHNSSRRQGVRGPYEDDFFNQEPGIYQAHQQAPERPPEVSYGQYDQSNTGTASRYIIPRASVRGAENMKENGYHRGTMVVDGRESFPGNRIEGPGGFYSGSSRYVHQNGGALQNGTGGRARDLGSYPSDLTSNRYGQSISLMQMHGVAPTANISDGYY